MTCDNARDLLFEEQEGLLATEQISALRAHLETCADCRAERGTLRETSAVLARGLQDMTAPVTPSPRFWQSLNAELDAVDAERRHATHSLNDPGAVTASRYHLAQGPGIPPGVREPTPERESRRARAGEHRGFDWPRRWVAAGALLVALLSGLIASGGPQQAWAALRHLLYFVPMIGIGQVAPTALVAAAPASASNGSIMLTVTGLVSGRRATLVSYVLSGTALTAPSSAVPVADAVEAALIGAHGQRYAVISWLPIQRGVEHGVPRVSGMLAFRPLAASERMVQLVAARMPLAPPAPRPWSVRLALRTAGSGAAQTSLPLHSSATHQGIRLTVTDVTFLAGATALDLDTAVMGGPYAGGNVVSLTPEQATGAFTPLLSTGHGTTLLPTAPTLPAPVRQAVLPRPEFVYGPVGRQHAALSLVVPAVEILLPGSTELTVQSGMSSRTITIGSIRMALVHARLVTPPAALGLDGEQRLRVTLAFPPAHAGGTVQSVDVVVDGVSRPIGRDAAVVEIPLAAGTQAIRMSLANPLVAVRGPWVIALGGPGTS